MTDVKLCSQDEGTYNTLNSENGSSALKSNTQKLNSKGNTMSALQDIGSVNQKSLLWYRMNLITEYSNFEEEDKSGDF